MSEADEYRRRSDDLMRLATAPTDFGERSRLIGEAVSWNMKAQEAETAAATRQLANGVEFERPDATEA